jgi:hypothetical protein
MLAAMRLASPPGSSWPTSILRKNPAAPCNLSHCGRHGAYFETRRPSEPGLQLSAVLGIRAHARYFDSTSAITLFDGSTITSLWLTIAKSYGCSEGLLAVTLLGIGSAFTLFGTKVPILASKPATF